MQTQGRFRDYFSFESILDREGNLICYHVTMIGTIEADGLARLRSDLGTTGDKKMAFGKITLRGVDRKINVLLRETDSHIYYHSVDTDNQPIDIINYAAKGWRADEVFEFREGDRVLLEGRAYLREVPSRYNPEEMRRELSVTVSGLFILGRKKRVMTTNSMIVPQSKNHAIRDEQPESSEKTEDDDDAMAVFAPMETEPAEEKREEKPVSPFGDRFTQRVFTVRSDDDDELVSPAVFEI